MGDKQSHPGTFGNFLAQQIDEKGYDVAVGMAETKQLTFRVRPKPRQGPQ